MIPLAPLLRKARRFFSLLDAPLPPLPRPLAIDADDEPAEREPRLRFWPTLDDCEVPALSRDDEEKAEDLLPPLLLLVGVPLLPARPPRRRAPVTTSSNVPRPKLFSLSLPPFPVYPPLATLTVDVFADCLVEREETPDLKDADGAVAAPREAQAVPRGPCNVRGDPPLRFNKHALFVPRIYVISGRVNGGDEQGIGARKYISLRRKTTPSWETRECATRGAGSLNIQIFDCLQNLIAAETCLFHQTFYVSITTQTHWRKPREPL